MATTLVADRYLDGGACAAGEAFTLNGGKLTIRTDTRWHANSPASMTGTLGALTVSATLGGGVLIDGRNVRWMPYNTGSSTVPAIGTSITQGGVTGVLLGVWASLTAAPTAVGASMPTSGFIKFREVTGGTFTTGALTGIGASATGPDVTGWIEIVQDNSVTNTISRKGSGHVTRGDWFYLDNTSGSVAQVLQVPTNGGGTGTTAPGVWIESAPSSGEYEFYPMLTTQTAGNGWLNAHIGTPAAEQDARQRFVKGLGTGQMQIGETVTTAATYSIDTAAAIGYTWANDLVTLTWTAHGLAPGQQVYLLFTSGGATANGVYTIEQVTGANNFTVVLAGAGASGNLTITAKTTITLAAHGLAIGNRVHVDATSGNFPSGDYEIITVPGSGTYTINVPTAQTGTGNCNQVLQVGYVPVSGCKTRVPNVFLRHATTAARANNDRTSLAVRPTFTTTGAGAIDHEYTYGDWNYTLSQPYSVRLQHCATLDAISISECATALDMLDGGVGMETAGDLVVLTLTSNFAGGTVEKWKFHRGNAPGTSDHAVTVSLCSGQSFIDCDAGIVQFARSSGYGWNINQSKFITMTRCRGINAGPVNLTTCTDVIVNDYDQVDRFMGYTNATSALYTFSLTSKCARVVIDGVTEGYSGAIPRQHSYSGVLTVSACDDIKLRNVGTRAAPLGNANRFNDRAAIYASGGNNSGISIQRCYVTAVRTSSITDQNTDKNVLYESVSAPFLSTWMPYTFTVAGLNARVKGCLTSLPTVSANASVYGTHWWDTFTSFFRLLSTYTWSANVVTVTSPTHGLVVGDKIYLDFTSGGGTPDGVYTVKTISSATVFTVALTGSGTSGNCIVWPRLVTTPSGLFTTEGRLHLPMNEATTETSGYVTKTGTAAFTSTPSLVLPVTGDQVVFETQHTVLGHTGFPNIPPLLSGVPGTQASAYTWSANVVTVTMAAHGLAAGDKVWLDATSGTLPDGLYTVASITSSSIYTINLTGSGTSGNCTTYRLFNLTYKINTGTGYGSSWANLNYQRVGGATTSGNGTITMASTTGVNVDDYIYGIGVGVDAKVQSIDSATQITATVNSVATGTNLALTFNHLPNETVSASTGFTLQVAVGAETPGSTMVITYLTVYTNTTAASQDNLYPLDTNTLTLTGLRNPTEVRVFSAGTTTPVVGQENVTTGTFTAQIDAGTYPTVDISILSLGYQNTRLLGVSMASNVSIPVQQIIDRQYQNA